MSSQAAELAHRLARNAEAVCRHYLSNGHREGRYWIVGDVANTPGRSLYVRLYGPPSGKRAAGKWTDYVAVLVMLRHLRLGAFPQTIDASTQHNVITRSAAAARKLNTRSAHHLVARSATAVLPMLVRNACPRMRPAPAFWRSSWSAIRSCASPSGRLRDAP